MYCPPLVHFVDVEFRPFFPYYKRIYYYSCFFSSSPKKMSFWNNLHLEFKCHISCSPMWHLNRDCDLWHLTNLRCLYEVSIFSQHLRLSASSFLDTIDAIWLRFVRLVALWRWLDWIHNFSSCGGHRWNSNKTNKKLETILKMWSFPTENSALSFIHF